MELPIDLEQKNIENRNSVIRKISNYLKEIASLNKRLHFYSTRLSTNFDEIGNIYGIKETVSVVSNGIMNEENSRMIDLIQKANYLSNMMKDLEIRDVQPIKEMMQELQKVVKNRKKYDNKIQKAERKNKNDNYLRDLEEKRIPLLAREEELTMKIKVKQENSEKQTLQEIEKMMCEYINDLVNYHQHALVALQSAQAFIQEKELNIAHEAA
ncbi:hypothetical protein WA158_003156 [Blastocystis sp. Blastoise]